MGQEALFSATDVTKTSDELRSESMKSKWSSPEHRSKISAAMADPAVKAKISASATAYWAELTPEERRIRMGKAHRALKGGHTVTRLEAKTIMHLNETDAWYRIHTEINGFIADILVAPALVIECDGASWHPQRMNNDASRDSLIEASGFTVLRLTEAEINNNDWSRLDEALPATGD